MKIGFFKIGNRQDDYIHLFLNSIKKCMPHAFIFQISDLETPAMEGIHEVVRFKLGVPYSKENHSLIYLKCLSELPIKEILLVDTDIIFEGNVYEAGEGNFDIGICNRYSDDGIIDGYNSGFIISKNRDFWEACLNELLKLKHNTGILAWQYVVERVVNEDIFKTRILEGRVYNRTPVRAGEYIPEAKVYHYKGFRKFWMPKHFSLKEEKTL